MAEKASLLIHDDRIARVLEPAPSQLPTSDSVIDLSGLTLFPGFIDVHIHGAVGVDTMEATAEGLNRVSEFLASQGVTAWLPTLVPAAGNPATPAVPAAGIPLDWGCARNRCALRGPVCKYCAMRGTAIRLLQIILVRLRP